LLASPFAILYTHAIKILAIDPRRIVVLAQSLGGNNAIAALAEEKASDPAFGVAGILLDSTFHSYSAIANDKIPGAGLLLSDVGKCCNFLKRA